MLSAHQITKSYGLHTVLQDITFSINPCDRLGLIGPNGCGKSTLLRILAGQEKPDSGTLAITRPGLRLGYLPQGFELDPGLTIAEACTPASALPSEAEFVALASLAAPLPAHPANKNLQSAYDAAWQAWERLSLPPVKVLAPLGLSDIPPEKRLGELSGGQKTRLLLARLLLSEPNLLLLDEPTNHLDIPARARFEQALAKYTGSVLAVIHDRYFIEQFATDTWIVEAGRIRSM